MGEVVRTPMHYVYPTVQTDSPNGVECNLAAARTGIQESPSRLWVLNCKQHAWNAHARADINTACSLFQTCQRRNVAFGMPAEFLKRNRAKRSCSPRQCPNRFEGFVLRFKHRLVSAFVSRSCSLRSRGRSGHGLDPHGPVRSQSARPPNRPREQLLRSGGDLPLRRVS